MTLYVRTNYVPEDCSYLTVGKLYEVTELMLLGILALSYVIMPKNTLSY